MRDRSRFLGPWSALATVALPLGLACVPVERDFGDADAGSDAASSGGAATGGANTGGASTGGATAGGANATGGDAGNAGAGGSSGGGDASGGSAAAGQAGGSAGSTSGGQAGAVGSHAGGSGGSAGGSTGGVAGAGGCAGADCCVSRPDCTPPGDPECVESIQCVNDRCAVQFAAAGTACSLGICSGTGFCGACEAGTSRCASGENTPEVCSNEGVWQKAAIFCSGATPVCSTGQCRSVEEILPGAAWGCARLSDGAVICWGANDRFQLGRGFKSPSEPPAPVPALPTARKLVAASDHACVITTSDELWCWGRVADISATLELPREIVELPDATRLETGVRDVSAFGGTTCWTHTAGLPGITCAGIYVCEGYMCFAEDAGLWQGDLDYFLGGAPLVDEFDAPVSGIAASQISLGGNAVCVIADDERLYCAGVSGIVGDGSQSAHQLRRISTVPTVPANPQLAAGFSFMCLGSGSSPGSVRCWGSSVLDGQTLVPATVETKKTSGFGTEPVQDFVGVVAGGWDACALRNDGVFCWGQCRAGLCGESPAPSDPHLPRQILSQASKLGMRDQDACAITDAGVMCWGASGPPTLMSW